MKRVVLGMLSVLAVVLVAGCDPEDRITFNVNTVSDLVDPNPGDDVCGTPDTCSLRAALEEAEAGDKKSITVNVPPGTYLLEEGQLEMPGKLISVQGAGADSTVIDAQKDSRVLKIAGGIVSVSDLTLQNGGDSNGSAGFGGGATVEEGVAAFEDVIIQNNDGYFRGGGLFVDSNANVVLTRALIRNNETGLGGGGGGGGIFNQGKLTINDSTISGNEGGNAGGGIGHIGERLQIRGSTISNNKGYRSGLVLNGPSVLSNVTVSGNRELANTSDGPGSFDGRGGWGISITGGVTFRNVTVTDNGNTVASRDPAGGGILVAPGGSLRLKNSLISGNRVWDCEGNLTSQGHNLIGDASTCTLSAGTGDQLGTSSAPIDAKLGDLLPNGGFTETHGLLPGSPAIDSGSNLAPASDPASCSAEDQRGVERPQEGDGSLPRVCDIGAFELEP